MLDYISGLCYNSEILQREANEMDCIARLKRCLFGESGCPEIKPLRVDSTRELITAIPISMFDDNNNNVVVVEVGSIDDQLLKTVREACERAAKWDKTLRLIINTEGGDALVAQAIAGILGAFGKDNSIHAIVTGKCYSAGMIVLMAVPADKRYTVEGSEFLVHAARISKSSARNGRTRAFDERTVDRIVSGSRVDKQSLLDLLKNGGDYYFPCEEAFALGIVTAII